MDASRAKIVPILRIAGLRRFATQTKASPKAAAKSQNVENTVLPNKMVVASIDSGTPVSRVSIIFRAGSRYETYDSLGASHYLRASAGLSTSGSSGFGITRNAQQIGANVFVTSDRETLSYNVEVTRDNLEAALDVLQNVAIGQIFKPWELSDNLPRLKDDIKRIPDDVRAVDLLHRAAFQNTLGNSIFVPKHQIGKISSETLQHFYSENCTTNRSAVVGVGIDHQLLVGFGQSLKIDSGNDSSPASQLNGAGEIRFDKSGRNATVAVATEGACLTNTKEALAFAILQYASGIQSNTKYGKNNGFVASEVANASKKVQFSTFNASYSDNGLFGFIISGDGKSICKPLEAAFSSLKSGKISDDDISRGKNGLKAAATYAFEDSAKLVQNLGTSVLFSKFSNLNDTIAAIDEISSADVKNAAKKVAGGKFSIASVGNLAEVPYVNSLN